MLFACEYCGLTEAVAAGTLSLGMFGYIFTWIFSKLKRKMKNGK